MYKLYRISWVENDYLLESYRHCKYEAEDFKNELADIGLYPLVTCDFTEYKQTHISTGTQYLKSYF